MSNQPITQSDLSSADPSKVKMLGKIESVRCDVQVGGQGERITRYYVTGVDWGYIFNNMIYIDPNIASSNEAQTLGNSAAIAIENFLFGNGGVPNSFSVSSNLKSLINIFGNINTNLTNTGTEINRLANAVYDFILPQEAVTYFNFVGPDGKPSNSNKINSLLTLYCGKLISSDEYSNQSEAFGFIDPFTLQGAHTFWQVLLDNSNPALNEMVSDFRWNTDNDTVTFALYNRIKPFSYTDSGVVAGSSNKLRSLFQYLPNHSIDKVSVTKLNAGTNWRDKYNFVEIKPNFQDFNTFQSWFKQKSQNFDSSAFSREGFRPLIVETKQFPGTVGDVSVGEPAHNATGIDFDQLASWSQLLREWHFNTHRLLNGTIEFVGLDDYIAVGDNISFSLDLITASDNITSSTLNTPNINVLAHVENVSHSFSVGDGGERTYRTTVQFVRGILINSQGALVGDGAIDQFASDISVNDEKNTKTVFGSSGPLDPDPNKLHGN